jgi:hypothetical protein
LQALDVTNDIREAPEKLRLDSTTAEAFTDGFDVLGSCLGALKGRPYKSKRLGDQGAVVLMAEGLYTG